VRSKSATWDSKQTVSGFEPSRFESARDYFRDERT
jgi:hypothetical protein